LKRKGWQENKGDPPGRGGGESGYKNIKKGGGNAQKRNRERPMEEKKKRELK